MKDTAIRKVFGKQQKLQGAFPALAIVQGLTQYDWEAAWPGIQKAMIGLGTAAIAALQGEAVARGLSGLASKIASFQPTASPAPGGTLLPEVSMPYIPAIPMHQTTDPYRSDYVPTKWLQWQDTMHLLEQDVKSFTPPPPPRDPCDFVRSLSRRANDLWKRWKYLGKGGMDTSSNYTRLMMLNHAIKMVADKFCEKSDDFPDDPTFWANA